MFGNGEIPATSVQAIALAAWEDGWCQQPGEHADARKLAQKLASAGTWGRYKGNVMRDIVTAAESCELTSELAKPYKVTIPGPDETQLEHEIFLPHELYHQLVLSKDGTAVPWCLQPDELARQDGMGALLRAWGRHPDVNIAHGLEDVAIFGLHCDGASYTSTMRAGGAKSVLVSSMNVISSPDSALRGHGKGFFRPRTFPHDPVRGAPREAPGGSLAPKKSSEEMAAHGLDRICRMSS